MPKTKPPTRRPSIDWADILPPEDAAVLNIHRRWASDTGNTAVVALHDRQHQEQIRSKAYSDFGKGLVDAEDAARRELAAVMSVYTAPDAALAAAKELAAAAADLESWRAVWGPFAPTPAWASSGSAWSDLINDARINDRPRVARWVLKQRAAGKAVIGDQGLIERLESEARREELNRLVAEENRAERHVHSLGSVA